MATIRPALVRRTVRGSVTHHEPEVKAFTARLEAIFAAATEVGAAPALGRLSLEQHSVLRPHTGLILDRNPGAEGEPVKVRRYLNGARAGTLLHSEIVDQLAQRRIAGSEYSRAGSIELPSALGSLVVVLSQSSIRTVSGFGRKQQQPLHQLAVYRAAQPNESIANLRVTDAGFVLYGHPELFDSLAGATDFLGSIEPPAAAILAIPAAATAGAE